MNIPVFRFELEGLRARVSAMLADHGDQINKMVQEKLTESLNEEWVEREIQVAVDEVLTEAIQSLANNYMVKSAMQDVFADYIVDRIKEEKKK